MQALAKADAAGSKDIPRAHRRKPTKQLAANLKHRQGRNAGIEQAALHGQYILTEIAIAAGLSASRVNRIVAARAREAKDKALSPSHIPPYQIQWSRAGGASAHPAVYFVMQRITGLDLELKINAF
jgi:hypothetical protein